MSKDAPASRWTREHGGRSNKGVRKRKIAWRWKWLASLHAHQLNRRPKDDVPERYRWGVWRPYACYWGEDFRQGEVCKKHWHVGRKSTSELA